MMVGREVEVVEKRLARGGLAPQRPHWHTALPLLPALIALALGLGAGRQWASVPAPVPSALGSCARVVAVWAPEIDPLRVVAICGRTLKRWLELRGCPDPGPVPGVEDGVLLRVRPRFCDLEPAPLDGATRLVLGIAVDVNRASVSDLTALPGIGTTLAGRIVASRLRDGPYRVLRELTRVNGIGPETVRSLRPYLTATSPSPGNSTDTSPNPSRSSPAR